MILGGIAVLVLAMCAIITMILESYNMVVEDTKKELEQEEEEKVNALANELYQDMIQHTEYRVRFGMRIVDGGCKNE